MALFDRFLRGGRHRAHAAGIALLEEGRFGEAVDQLREAAYGHGDAATSIASYHFRLALVGEGRRLLRLGDHAGARTHFAEAVELWPVYPDLHCLLGAACAAAQDWDDALARSRSALRVNPDYVEARLLEAAALQQLGRRREAAESLNALLESGRRVEHWLLERLARPAGWKARNLPKDLEALVVEAVATVSEKEAVTAAVALCRAGRWEEGSKRFADLVQRRPRYPDYRTRHAAALFQLGRNDAALAELEAALALNESYLAAADLKALVLADGGRCGSAHRFLADCDRQRGTMDRNGTHEALFAAYLRGVLAVLLGRPAEVAGRLEGWTDLPRIFARAELLLAAAEDLSGRSEACAQRLEVLAAEWSGESVYTWLLACHLLREGRYRDLEKVLSHWPADARGADPRPLFLEGHLAVDLGRPPALPPGPIGKAGDGADEPLVGADGPTPGPAAWTFLAARAAWLKGDREQAWSLCRELAREGMTERSLRLQTLVAAGDGDPEETWSPEPLLPESCLAAATHLHLARDEADAADRLLAGQIRLHPHDPLVCWLSSGFWLEPVRGWIG